MPKPAALLAFCFVFTTAGAAYSFILLRPGSASLGNIYEPNNAQEAHADTVSIPRPASTIKLEPSTPSAHNESHIEQELTVNGQTLPIPENRESRHTISENGSEIDVTIDNRQRSTSNTSSHSTHISTEVHVTQEGGD